MGCKKNFIRIIWKKVWKEGLKNWQFLLNEDTSFQGIPNDVQHQPNCLRRVCARPILSYITIGIIIFPRGCILISQLRLIPGYVNIHAIWRQ